MIDIKDILLQRVFNFFDEKTASGVASLAHKSAVKNENMSNKKLAEDLHKPVIRKNFFKKYTLLQVIRGVLI